VCDAVLRFIQDGDVIDIGSNIGLIALGVNLQSNSKIHCFECNASTFECLRYNTEPHSNIFIYNFAITDKPQVCSMAINEFNLECNQIRTAFDVNSKEYAHSSTSYTFKTNNEITAGLPMDLFVNMFNKIDVIKIDVEGFEYQVLLGAKSLIALHQPAIIIEIFNEYFNKINEILKNYNYMLLETLYDHNYIYVYIGVPTNGSGV